MTAQRDLKRIIRERQKKTGESYTAARAHVMRARALLLVPKDDDAAEGASLGRVEAAVLKVNRQSARVRILGEEGQVTFRSRDVRDVVPGHLVTLIIEKRWTWGGDAYASGRVENPRIAVDKLGLAPLRLAGGDVVDLRAGCEPFREPDPYASLWRKLTDEPRAWFEMEQIAWGLDGENPTSDVAERLQLGDREGARECLMNVLAADLRCIDAHACLGNLEFEQSPQRALVHYQLGVRIGELSLPPGFDGVLVWGRIYNRPFLRCLHGYGLCLWRLGKLEEARAVFERILSLNPHDNQAVRDDLTDVLHGRSWVDPSARETAVPAERRRTLH